MTTYLVIANLLAAEHAAESTSWVAEYLTIIRSPAHWFGEATIELGLGLTFYHAFQAYIHHVKGKLTTKLRAAIYRLAIRITL